MKRHLLLKSLLLLFALVVGTNAWATDQTITAGALTNGVLTDSPFTLTFAKNNGSTDPTYNSTGGDLRLYAKGSVQVDCSGGKMTEIVFNISTQGLKRLAPITASVGTISTQSSGDNTVTWTGNASSVTFTVGDKANYGSDGSSKAGQLCFSTVDITYSTAAVAPSISANDVNITAGATAGSISYTINNAVTGGALTAAKTSDSDWLTVGAVSASAVAFTTEENTGAARSATVRLTYTYDTNKTVTKDVTVTQAVYVEPVVFTELYESFDTQSSTGGNTGGFATCSNSSLSSYGNWTLQRVYPADRCFKVGTTSSGSIETPALKLNSEVTYVLTFKAAPWSSDGTTLTLSSSDAIFGGKTSKNVTMSANKWTSYYVELTAGLPTSKVKFAPAKRCFIDEVRVMEKSTFDALTASKAVGSYGWATYIPDYAVEFESGDAYVVTAAAVSSGLTLEGVTKVPAKTPVLLKGAGDKTINVINDASVIAPATNLLIIGNGKALADGYYPYVLAKNGENSACFKQWTGNISDLNGRVMLVLNEEAASRAIFDLDSETTAIETVKAEKANNEYYNLAGQRIAQPTKGLYIVNGKKVIIK